MTDESLTEIETWARAHDFKPSDEQISGATPLLRLGELDTTDDAYKGAINKHDAWLAEFSIGSPNFTADLGGDGLIEEAFTLFLVSVDASRWPRLTVHPSRYPDHDLVRRAFHVDHRVHTVSPVMEARYRVLAATETPDEQLDELFTPELIAWWLAQDPEISVDIEDHGGRGGFLTVAHHGLGLDDSALNQLFEQTRRLLTAVSRLAGS